MAISDTSATMSEDSSFEFEETRTTIDFAKDTCAIIGTAHTGPAFVPKSFIEMGALTPDNPFGNTNTFARYFGDPTGSFNITSNARLAADRWLSQANEKQVSFIRVLGAGNGKETNSRGVVEKAGFVVGTEQVSGTTNHGVESSNKYANEDGVPGRTFFLGGFYYPFAKLDNNTMLHPAAEAFDQCNMTPIDGVDVGLAGDEEEGTSLYPIITGILMFPSGVNPGLSQTADAALDGDEVAKGVFGGDADKGQHLGKFIKGDDDSKYYTLLLNGQKEDNSKNFSFNKASSLYYQDVFNKDPAKIEEEGHLLYAAYDPSHAFHGGLKQLEAGHTAFILSGEMPANTSDSDNPNYEDFRARYRTASTPWIVSQTFAADDSDRSDIESVVRNLFKFYSRFDGDVGNKSVYTIIQPVSIGTKEADNSEDPGAVFSKFNVFVIDYNTNKILERFDSCNLHPKSKDYIGKKIGTQYEYYNWETDEDKQKVVSKGKYFNQSQYIRVEIHEDVEELRISHETMPSGFRGYRHITTEFNGSSLLSNISDFNIADALINSDIFSTSFPRQCPVPYSIQLKTDNNETFTPAIDDLSDATKIEHPTWGVNKRFSYSYDRTKDTEDDRSNNILKPGGYYFIPSITTNNYDFDFSRFLPDAVQDGVPASLDSDADSYNNNLFHLEKIIVQKGNTDELDRKINWNLATYRRDGKELYTAVGDNGRLHHEEYSSYLNISKDLNVYDSNPEERSTLKSLAEHNSKHLGFAIYLAGGFDGTNIFDADKSNFTSDACVREENDELQNGDLDGPTIISYKKAANLIKDENLLFRDIVCMPGIESNVLRKNMASSAAEEKTYLYIQDIPLSDFDYQIVTGSKETFLNNAADGFGVEDVEDQDVTIIRNTAEAHRRNFFFSEFNASYFGEIQTKLLATTDDQVTKIVPPTISALETLAKTSIGLSPSGKELSIGAAQDAIITNFNDGDNNTNTFRDLYRRNDINVISDKDGAIRVTSARTEDDRKPSLGGAIGTRRARSEIRKRIRDMTIRNFLFNNYSTKIEPFVIEYNRSVTRILQQYVASGVLKSFETNINSRNMTKTDLQNGILEDQ